MVTPSDWRNDRLFKAYGLAAGLLLARTSVIKTVEPPWFWHGYEEVSGTQLGDNHWFCHRAHEQGYEVCCDAPIEVGRQGGYTYSVRDFVSSV